MVSLAADEKSRGSGGALRGPLEESGPVESTSRSALYDEAARGTGRVRQQEDAPGTFFLTLCPVAAPVSLPRSTSPALQRFRFFFTREQDGARERH